MGKKACFLPVCITLKAETAIATGNWEFTAAAAAGKSLHSCPILCDPIDGSPPGSTIPGILQARTLEWAAIAFSNAWKWTVKVKSLSRVWLLVTPWTAAYQAPPSMGVFRQEYWSGVPLPPPENLLDTSNCAQLSIGSQRMRHDWSDWAHMLYIYHFI